ncbi:MAG: hydroxyacylglutathione hydrolase [Chitinispirillia bacterium]|jgi:hydroxyacylglutathione hydrolase
MKNIYVIPALSDNYIYIIQYNREAAVVDPSQAEPVLDFLKKNNLHLSEILITHHHFDHTGGVKKLKNRMKCKTVESKHTILKNQITQICQTLPVEIIPVPGHTMDHVVFYIPEFNALFTGDTLFASGCGRIFEGTPEVMYKSLQKLMFFDDDTRIYFGHEYTEENLRFAQSVDPENEEIEKKLSQIRKKLQCMEFTTPSLLGEEKKTNPFLRSHTDSIRRHLNMETASDIEVFKELRNQKNVF